MKQKSAIPQPQKGQALLNITMMGANLVVALTICFGRINNRFDNTIGKTEAQNR
jgi:hypothetical protein